MARNFYQRFAKEADEFIATLKETELRGELKEVCNFCYKIQLDGISLHFYYRVIY